MSPRPRRAHPAKWSRRVVAGGASFAVAALTLHLSSAATTSVSQSSPSKVSTASASTASPSRVSTASASTASPSTSSTRPVTTSRGS